MKEMLRNLLTEQFPDKRRKSCDLPFWSNKSMQDLGGQTVWRLLWLKACDSKTIITEPTARGKADIRVQAFGHATQEQRGQTPRPREVKGLYKPQCSGNQHAEDSQREF